MWGSPSSATCSPPSTADIQTRMEKYLNDESSSRDFDDAGGGADERCRVGDRAPAATGARMHEFQTGGRHGADVKPNSTRYLHSDVLDLHKEGGGAGGGGGTGLTGSSNSVGSSAASDRDAAAVAAAAAAAAVISRWQPLGQSPPRAHNHSAQLSQPIGVGSPPPPLSLPRPIGSVMRQVQRPPPESSVLNRFGPLIGNMRDRFEMGSGDVQDVSMEPTSSTMPSGGVSTSQVPSTTKVARTIKSYHCRMCEQEFANKSDMQRHAKEAHRMEDKGHKCTQCLKSFPSSQQLAQHSLVHTNVRKYACNYCDKAFKQLSHVQQHQRIHTGERPYRCPVEGCSKAFRQLSSLQQHLKGHNIPMPKSYPVTRTVPPPSTAGSPMSGSPSSGHEGSSGNKLNSSLARPHDLTCQVCEKHCADEVRFFCHIHKYHPDYWRVFSGGRPLSDFIETPVTASSEPSPGDGHTEPPHREKRYACSVCHKRYSHETGYVKHMAGHPGFGGAEGLGTGFSRVSLYNCTVCAKLFTKEAYLLRHMEMKLDPAHAAGLDELKKSSGMFRSSTAPVARHQSSYGSEGRAVDSDGKSDKLLSRPASVDDGDDRMMSSPNGRYNEDAAVRHSADVARRQVSRSASCVSPMSSASSASPASPPSFVPYPSSRDDTRRLPFVPDVVHYPQPLPATSDYLRRSIDAYRSPPYPSLSASRSPALDEDMHGSSPEADEGRDIRSHGPRYSSVPGNQHRHSDYYLPSSPYNRFQPFPSPVATASRSGMVSPGIGATPFAYPQYPLYGGGPSHLYDNYHRRSTDLSDREVVNSFR